MGRMQGSIYAAHKQSLDGFSSLWARPLYGQRTRAMMRCKWPLCTEQCSIKRQIARGYPEATPR